jgi:hypothetical protein
LKKQLIEAFNSDIILEIEKAIDRDDDDVIYDQIVKMGIRFERAIQDNQTIEKALAGRQPRPPTKFAAFFATKTTKTSNSSSNSS